MMEYSISEISRIIGLEDNAKISNPDLKIERLLTDSRSLTYPAKSLFFALKTTSGDGHRYLTQLYDKGVRNFVVTSIPDDMSTLSDVNFLAVKSVTESSTPCRLPSQPIFSHSDSYHRQ